MEILSASYPCKVQNASTLPYRFIEAALTVFREASVLISASHSYQKKRPHGSRKNGYCECMTVTYVNSSSLRISAKTNLRSHHISHQKYRGHEAHKPRLVDNPLISESKTRRGKIVDQDSISASTASATPHA